MTRPRTRVLVARGRCARAPRSPAAGAARTTPAGREHRTTTTHGATTTSRAPGDGHGTARRLGGATSLRAAPALTQFSSCMRSHGVPNFPDPGAQGRLTINASSGIDPGSPQFQSAQRACAKYLPNGGQPPSPAAAGEDAGAGAQVLGLHALARRAELPRPAVPRAAASRSRSSAGSGIDPGSPQFQAAQQACQADLPGKAAPAGGRQGTSGGFGASDRGGPVEHPARRSRRRRRRRRRAGGAGRLLAVVGLRSWRSSCSTRSARRLRRRRGGRQRVPDRARPRSSGARSPSQTQVSATLGYADPSTISVPAGTAPSSVTQAQQAVSTAQSQLSSAQATQSADETALGRRRRRSPPTGEAGGRLPRRQRRPGRAPAGTAAAPARARRRVRATPRRSRPTSRPSPGDEAKVAADARQVSAAQTRARERAGEPRDGARRRRRPTGRARRTRRCPRPDG